MIVCLVALRNFFVCKVYVLLQLKNLWSAKTCVWTPVWVQEENASKELDVIIKKKHLHCGFLDIYATTKARVKIMFADMLSPKMTILDTLGKTEDDPTLSIPWTKYCKNLAFHIFSYAGCLWQWLFIFAPRRKSINFISKHFNGVAF